MKAHFPGFFVSCGLLLVGGLAGRPLFAESFSYQYQSLKPADHLFAPTAQKGDIFQGMTEVGVAAQLTIGQDCGRINVDATFNSMLKIFSKKNLESLAQGLLKSVRSGLGAMPLLTTCYMSPTMCSVLKHTQVSVDALSKLRLDQCQIIDKYVDSRTEDYYRARQTCARQEIDSSQGDLETALSKCETPSASLTHQSWSGSQQPESTHALLADSAAWAKFNTQEGSAKKTMDLITSFVGDTVVSQGNFSVEFGPKKTSSPRAYLGELEGSLQNDLCQRLVPEMVSARDRQRELSDDELKREIKRLASLNSSLSEEQLLVLSPSLLRNLAYLPLNRRARICSKLAQALAMTNFSKEMHDALDLLTIAAQNPHLPPNRKQEIENKRVALKDQIELTLALKHEQQKPLGEVLHYIAEEGLQAQDEAIQQNLQLEAAQRSGMDQRIRLKDCSDGVFCSDTGSGRF